MVVPERFQGVDNEEDVTGTDRNKPDFMHQSVYGVIGAHWPSFGLDKLPGLFEAASGSDSEGHGADTDSKDVGARSTGGGRSSLEAQRRDSRKVMPVGTRTPPATSKGSSAKTTRARTEASEEDAMSQSQFLPPKEVAEDIARPASASEVRSDAPHLDRRLEAEAKADANDPSISSVPRADVDAPAKAKINTSKAVADIFQLSSPEEVIREYDCWYLLNILMPGYMYITTKHLCFFSYLHRKGDRIIKSGYLGKQGKHNPRYRRYWFTLRGDVLTYYVDASKPYFPNGSIDLRYATSAELVPEKGQDDIMDSRLFTVTNDARTHYFKADSAPSAQEWVKSVHRVVFRQRNDGDSLKISIPLINIVGVESSPIIGMVETIRMRVIDNEDSCAVDEYFFTFSGRNKDPLATLNRLTKDNEVRSWAPDPHDVKRLQATVASPLRHAIPTRASPSSPTASDHAPSSPDADEVDIMSASQMLTGDEAFRAPTLRTPQQALPKAADGKFLRASEKAAVSNSSRQRKDPPTAPPHSADQSTLPLRHRPRLSGERQRPSNALVQPATEPKKITLATPLQYAYGLANQVSSTTTRGLSYLGSSPKEYYNRFSGALAGGKRHYSEADGLSPEDRIDDPESAMDVAEHERRFREHFGLPESERLVAVFYCSLHRVLPLYGKVYIGTRNFCFRSLIYGTRTKLVVPFVNTLNVEKEKGFRWGYPGMVVVIRGHEEIFFDFNNNGLRDDCVVTVLRALDSIESDDELTELTAEEQTDADAAAAEHELLLGARQDSTADTVSIDMQMTFDDPTMSIIDFKPKKCMKITCLTIGSRGDVQPYIALCKGLLAEGMKPRIATHMEFKDWVERHGIEFVPVGGDPAELMRMCVDNGMFTPKFIWKASTQFRGWLDDLLDSAYRACKGSDLIIESPSAMCGIHIAEALSVPYFRAFTMPWTRTRAYPHAFAVPGTKYGGQWNQNSYAVFDTVFWAITSGQLNRWRTKRLGLPPTTLGRLQPNKVPFLYNFSPNVVVPPLDFSDWVKITGYWFLDEGQDFTPSADLQAFIDKARKAEQKIVYIGFGSVTVNDSRQLTQQVVDAVRKADVHCILSKGWSDRFDTDKSLPEVMLPDSVFLIRAAPHDWLFNQIDAVVHHGGAGTTGASLRAGVPTIIKPFFGDQFFFATRVEDLGVGIHLEKITVNSLGKALWIATHDERMRTKARRLGEKIRKEDGVATAIKAIWRDLEYAKSLIKKRPQTGAVSAAELEEADEIESWTFVEDLEMMEGSGMGSQVGSTLAQQQQQQEQSWGLPSISKASVLGSKIIGAGQKMG
ncbi:Sterol 3-beta-glucosyltransferase [Recurvomyces mirabilis]|uniref:sterol 3beta-glucosyltransferase n=1 Tax=Recurvomyces mirabilis TaxID=574656 RepID=A0AAE0TQY2_9PEZI|nr:Sterol 3-beta-glucosyltransferase [Recurvomyces mirabilis]KAK5152463.1 Sterol 3-beta-glucosyltransferase [Recurvomyces mirabilis]